MLGELLSAEEAAFRIEEVEPNISVREEPDYIDDPAAEVDGFGTPF